MSLLLLLPYRTNSTLSSTIATMARAWTDLRGRFCTWAAVLTWAGPSKSNPSSITRNCYGNNSHISNIAVISAISGSKSCLWSACWAEAKKREVNWVFRMCCHLLCQSNPLLLSMFSHSGKKWVRRGLKPVKDPSIYTRNFYFFFTFQDLLDAVVIRF